MNMSLLVELSTLFGIKGNPGRPPSVIVVDEDLFLRAIQEYGPVVVSQAKWLFIAKAVASFNSFVSDGAHKTCAMCVVHYRPHAAYRQECALCPIYKESGFDSCIGTPYEGYQKADDVVTMRTMAMNEVDFLEKFTKENLMNIWAIEDELLKRARNAADDVAEAIRAYMTDMMPEDILVLGRHVLGEDDPRVEELNRLMSALDDIDSGSKVAL